MPTQKPRHDSEAIDFTPFDAEAHIAVISQLVHFLRCISWQYAGDIVSTAGTLGKAFQAGRCMLLLCGSGSELQTYEYCDQTMEPLAPLFDSPQGKLFARLATQNVEQVIVIDRHKTQTLFGDAWESSFEPIVAKLSVNGGRLFPLRSRPSELGETKNFGLLLVQESPSLVNWGKSQWNTVAIAADCLSLLIECDDLTTALDAYRPTDLLTGLATRSRFADLFSRELERARLFGEPLSLVLVDIDHLSLTNHALGFPFGNAVIKTVAVVLMQCIRTIDIAGRWGGDKFTIVLPRTDIEDALKFAERTRRRIVQAHLRLRSAAMERTGNVFGEGDWFPESASFGVVSFPEHGDDMDTLLMRVEMALQAAKDDGKNTVCAFSNR